MDDNNDNKYINDNIKAHCREYDALIFIEHNKLSMTKQLFADDGIHIRMDGVNY